MGKATFSFFSAIVEGIFRTFVQYLTNNSTEMDYRIVCERVESLRCYLASHHLSAFIFPSTDPHCGEYVPDHWKSREWISGFDGSAGTAVVTLHAAALWTDSRYFLAAEEQLKDTPFQLMKERMTGTPSIAEWLTSQLETGDSVGLDGWVNTVEDTEALNEELASCGIQVLTHLDPASELWKERPSIPLSPIELHPLNYSGEDTFNKLERLREQIIHNEADGLVLTQLDDIAWLCNLRGSDVHCNPVFVSYMLITSQQAFLYTDVRKLRPEVEEYLKGKNISLKGYESIGTDNEEPACTRILVDPSSCNWTLYHRLSQHHTLIRQKSPVPSMKARKNSTEIDGFHQAMKRDGVALVKFLRWLETAVLEGKETEMSIDAKLTSLRAEQPLFRGLSFDTIAAYGPHGAIVHYEATDKTDVPLEPHGLLLLDSGAQYEDGTTDITRTISLGPLTYQEQLDYTLVLKGHIRLALCKFPAGASGTQIDAMARYAMWQYGINFGHGTGHGVGSFLNVHEGPHQIRMNYVPAPLLAGMTVTNEPGIYRAGQHGVRIENTMLIEPFTSTEFGDFLQLTPLTLCPIDTKPILVELMQKDEVDYLNSYHAHVLATLEPLLEKEEDRAWLRSTCQKIQN